MVSSGYKYRDALRLLFILHGGARALELPDPQTGAVGVFEGEKRLMAIDFWIRYPDYLAEHLLDIYEAEEDVDLLRQIASIFDNEEPDVRVIKMARWKRGAFEHIEDALSVLASRKLVVPVKKPLPTGKFQHDFMVFPAVSKFLQDAVTEETSIKWYAERTELALRVAGFKSGHALKDIQYEEPEYEEAALGAFIPSIKDRVLERLNSVKARQQ